jgi:transcriptional regulator with XRE-family HTH domain
MTFGQNLQKLRKEADLSQSQLAGLTGIPVKTIQSWEISRRTPRWIDMLARLAKGLKVPIESLVPEEEGEGDGGRSKSRRARPATGAAKRTGRAER